MAEGAALLVDEVLPREPMRQWVLSVPFALRYLFATAPAVMGQVLSIVTRAIASHLVKAAGYHHTTAQNGAVTLIERALERQGLLVRDFENSFLTVDTPDGAGFEDLLGHSITYRIALGPHQGRKACMDSSSFASTSLKGKRVDCQRVSGL